MATFTPLQQRQPLSNERRSENGRECLPAASTLFGSDGAAGVAIPIFLQPLFGLETLPFVAPPPQQTPTIGAASLAQRTDCNSSSIHATPTQSNKSIRPEQRQPADADSVPTVPALVTPPSTTTSCSSRKQPPRRFGSFMKQFKRRNRTRSGTSSTSITASSSFQDEPTPRRKGRTPTETSSPPPLVKGLFEQLRVMEEHHRNLLSLQEQTAQVRARASEMERLVGLYASEAERIQLLLAKSLRKLDTETAKLEKEQKIMIRLESEADRTIRRMEDTLRDLRSGKLSQRPESFPRTPPFGRSVEELTTESSAPSFLISDNDSSSPVDTPARSRSNTGGSSLPSSSSFIRIKDLDVESSTSSITSIPSVTSPRNKDLKEDELFFIDRDTGLILDRLFQVGQSVCMDESDRFQPNRETQRLLSKHGITPKPIDGWPFGLWREAKGKEVLTWTGKIGSRGCGFGDDWPVIKTRGIVSTTPRNLVQFLLDSSKIKTYNKMSQGREDILVLQDGVETSAEESEYGVAGDARIIRALVKPKMLPKTIEMISLWYSKQIEESPGSYMIVNRSIWEDDSDAHELSDEQKDMLRSEMLLGVQLLRPVADGCELTMVTHVFSPGVPELLAKRAAPSSAAGILSEIQKLFPKTAH